MKVISTGSIFKIYPDDLRSYDELQIIMWLDGIRKDFSLKNMRSLR